MHLNAACHATESSVIEAAIQCGGNRPEEAGTGSSLHREGSLQLRSARRGQASLHCRLVPETYKLQRL